MRLSIVIVLAIAAAGAGCSKSNDKVPETSTAKPAGDDGLPPECADFKAAIAKIQTCEKLPRDLRDRIQADYDKTYAEWMRLSERVRAQLGTACKVGIRSYMTADVKKTCGW